VTNSADRKFMDAQVSLVPVERIERAIILVRGEKVMLDAELAEIYGVETKRVNEQVRRNLNRFPPDFMFQLTADEWDSLRSQFATLKRGQHRKYLPYAFTEHGALMLANVLNSERAAQTSVMVVRAFVRLRQLLSACHGKRIVKLKRDKLRDARPIEVRQIAALMPAAKAFLQFLDGWFPIPFALGPDEFEQADVLTFGELVWTLAAPLRPERGIYAASSNECRGAFISIRPLMPFGC
jgi:hypothetical protein